MDTTLVFDTYWRFAAERQAIYFRRLADPIGPWTSDPVLSAHRFTNAYRASDRVSQYLIREVQYREERPRTPREIFFRTLLFKLFNRIETWELLEGALGPLTWEGSDLNEIEHTLDRAMAAGLKLYSPAYIMPAPKLGHARKHANHLALLEKMIEDRLPERVRQAPNLRAIYELLLAYPGLGPFLAFQYAIDLNYSEMLDHDEGDFVIAGPGALDGIAKCFVDTKNHSAEEIIFWVCEQQDRAFATADLKFQDLFGRKLQPIDCQNLFCEISKYARVVHPDVKGLSGRTRIKQVYRKSLGPMPQPTFPPKWNLEVPTLAAPVEQRPVKDLMDLLG